MQLKKMQSSTHSPPPTHSPTPCNSTWASNLTTSSDMEMDSEQGIQTQEEFQEEEAFYVFEFGKHLTHEELRAVDYQCKLVGLESDHPFLQIGGSIFRGTTHQSLGNDLIFVKSTATPQNGNKSQVHYQHTMDRRIKMTPVRLDPKPKNPAALRPIVVDLSD